MCSISLHSRVPLDCGLLRLARSGETLRDSVLKTESRSGHQESHYTSMDSFSMSHYAFQLDLAFYPIKHNVHQVHSSAEWLARVG